MPYPNEHSCRLKDPGGFKPESFRRVSRDHEGKKYDIVMGRLKGETTMTEQAYRYAKDKWGEGEARTHCKEHDGTFEPAIKEEMARGQGKGVGGDIQKDLGAKYCVCPECGHSQKHPITGEGQSIPCAKIKCPECGKMMVGSDTPKISAEIMEIFYRGGEFAFEEGARFKKDLIQVGTFLHPQRKEERIRITKKRMEKWIANFQRYKANGGDIHIPIRHTEDPRDNAGWLEDMMIEDDKLFGILEITDEDIVKKVESKSIKDVSISISPDFLDEKGNKYDEIIDHIALTVIPQIRGQGPFVKLESGEFEALEEEKPADELGDKEKDKLSLSKSTTEEEMKELEELKKKLVELEKVKTELEDKLKKGKDTNLEALKTELEARKKEVEKLNTFRLEQEKKDREATVEDLISTKHILPPAQRENVLVLLEHYSGEVTTSKIEFESKKEDGSIEKKTIEANALLLEVLNGIPGYVGFKEITKTDIDKEKTETEETKRIGKETAEQTTGTSVSLEKEKSK